MSNVKVKTVLICFIISKVPVTVNLLLQNQGWGVRVGVRVGRNFRWSRSQKEFLGGVRVRVGVGKKCTDSNSDLSLKS
jgi:hypothetical protein